MTKIYSKCVFALLLSVGLVTGIQGQTKPIADGNEKFLGCAYSTAQSSGFTSLWNQVTPENGGKWGSVEGTRNTMRWNDMDASYNVAKNNGLIFKEHTLIWGSQQPSWIGALDSAAQRQEIEQWFLLLAQRYPDMPYIDVVNEPLHNAPNGMKPWGSSTPNVDYAKALGGAGQTGWDWIIESFRLARKYFPNSKLIMNEYSVINSSTETQNYIKIINLLKAESLIDGIGEQAHAFTTAGTSTSTMKANLDALAATGIPIYLTEMDVDGATDQAQLKEMQRVFKLFWDHPGVKGITMWGFRPGMWRTDQGAYLVTQAGKERPALTWMKAYVNDSVVNAQSIAVSILNDTTATIVKGSTVDMVAEMLPLNATIKNVSWSVSLSSLASIDATGKLTAIAPGRIKVTATAWDGSNVSGSINITIVKESTNAAGKIRAERVRVFPNPATDGNFTISGIDGINRIVVYDLTGKKVSEYQNLNQSELQVRIGSGKGIYLLSLFDGTQIIRRKITVN